MSTSNQKEIYFYAGGYNALSNFSAFQVLYNGFTYVTLEHAYQAMRFTDTAIQKEIKEAASPLEAQKIARAYAQDGKECTDWHEINMDLMKELHHLRFEQHEYLKEKLLQSSNSLLVHKTPEGSTSSDVFWGIDEKGNGENHLGKILMELRDMYFK
jgi:ribA/ribD-fused uncharacterized protein